MYFPGILQRKNLGDLMISGFFLHGYLYLKVFWLWSHSIAPQSFLQDSFLYMQELLDGKAIALHKPCCNARNLLQPIKM